MGHEDELTIEELQEILNVEHQETQRNVSPEQEEDERGPMPKSAIKDLFKKSDERRHRHKSSKRESHSSHHRHRHTHHSKDRKQDSVEKCSKSSDAEASRA
ncbi:hypothetical protein TNCV_2002551 [Trichonephila clavipes]|nr:hypothetical protein TNCV_2002551 [Trichonephila clavipes]